MKKFLIILFSLLCSGAIADDIRFTASGPGTVSTGQSFRVSYSVNAKGSGFKGPAFTGFQIVSGPNQSTSSSVQIFNGNMTQTVEYSYSYILQAVKEGSYSIPAATITIDGKSYSSNALTINVVKGAAPQQNNAANNNTNGNNNTQSQNAKISAGDIFVRSTPSKKTVYLGEPLVVTHKIYSKLNLVGFESTKFPAYSGFWTEEIKMPDHITLNNENYDGAVYHAAELKKTVLFPQKTGNITIDPTELECVIRVQRRTGSVWDNFFGGNVQDVKQTVKNAPLVINVLPLPENGKPEDFSGITGNFKLVAEISTTKAKTNDAIDLSITISGSGNLRLIEKLNFDFPPDIEVYDPKISDNISVNAGGVSGSRKFEYILIPRSAGTFKVKPVTFSYFDVQKKSYETLSTPEYTLEIDKGTGSAGNVVTTVKREDVKYVGSDIRFINVNSLELYPQAKSFFNSTLFYIFLVAPAVIFGAFIIAWRRRIKANSNIMLVKNRKATRVARKRLHAASVFMKELNRDAFYEEVFKALTGYVSDKLSIPYSDLSKDTIRESLVKKGISDEMADEFMKTLDDCEFERFAPTAAQSDVKNIYDRAIAIVSKLENSYKI